MSKRGIKTPRVSCYGVSRKVEPYTGQLNLSSSELDLFDNIASEVTSIAGTTIDLFHFNEDESQVDELYDEFIERKYDGPYRLKAYVSYPDSVTSAGEEGFRVEWNCIAWIARKTLEEAGAPTPLEGDIISIWGDIPFFQDYKVPGSGYYFDLQNVSDDGHVHDNPAFVGFKCILKRNSTFTPERKILPP